MILFWTRESILELGEKERTLRWQQRRGLVVDWRNDDTPEN